MPTQGVIIILQLMLMQLPDTFTFRYLKISTCTLYLVNPLFVKLVLLSQLNDSMVLGIPLKLNLFHISNRNSLLQKFCIQTFITGFTNLSYAQPVKCSAHTYYFSGSFLILSFSVCLGPFIKHRLCYFGFYVTHHITFHISAEGDYTSLADMTMQPAEATITMFHQVMHDYHIQLTLQVTMLGNPKLFNSRLNQTLVTVI